MRIVDGIPIFGTEVDEGALAQIKNCSKTAAKCALMADHHKGYAVPIGGVVAYEDAISPSGVGYDIGCGNKAVRLDCDAEDVKARIGLIMDDVFKNISFGIGRKNAEQVDHQLFYHPTWKLPAISGLKYLAEQQLGTVGSGNHYVDIFVDEQNRIWVGVHFGSRGFGHKTASFFLNEAGAVDNMDADPCVISTKTTLGQDYIFAMELAGAYAYAGRNWVCQRVAQIIGGTIMEEVHNHHNFAWRENGLWVVRKGATPAFPGQKGFVGGSMAENAVIVEGVDMSGIYVDGTVQTVNELALNSTIHGAGRVMGRRAAAGKTRIIARWRCQNYRKCEYTAAKGGFFKEEGGPTPKCPQCGHKLKLETMRQQISEGKVTAEMMAKWVRESGVELRGAGRDESPDCYKRLPDVLAAQGSGIRVLHTLRPLGVAMAGENEYDPYKD